MLNEVIYRGLVLTSDKCRYYSVKEGDYCSLVEDLKTSTLTLTYTPGSTSSSLSIALGITAIGKDLEMMPMGMPKKFNNTTISLNGLRLKKLTHDSHVIHIIIVEDTESRVVQDYRYTTIVVSSEDYKNQDFINFLFYSGNLLYIKPIGVRPKCYEIRNFPRIIIGDKSLELESGSEDFFNLRRHYDDYVIRAIDYQDQFIIELRKILMDYGIELVRVNKEKTLSTTSYISYQFMQTPIKYNHPRYSDLDRQILHHKQPVEFIFSTPDMVMFFDFKNKYNNVDLLTNFCEFKTTDKYGNRWTASIKWGQITEDFSHTYNMDNNSNFSNQCQFRCELYFYEMLDDSYEFLTEIIQNLENI
jgi:hypothetical protein